MQKILHFCHQEKFISDFIGFIGEHFDMSQHEFRVFGGDAKYLIPELVNVKVANVNKFLKIKDYLFLIIAMCRARKIIIHSLFNPMLIRILWSMPWLLKKCYWVMWGGDLYVYQLGERNWNWRVREFFRRPVIKNMGHFVCYITGEYDLAKKWYGVSGEHHRCFMYTSNLYQTSSIEPKAHNGIAILVGNSADPSNNHLEIFDKLKAYKDQDISIYVPLSYGNRSYAQHIIVEGKKIFGDKLIPLIEFLPFEDYLKLLAKIDIAIFNHKRQQGMGNIRTLLGLGKKVYMNQGLTSSESLRQDGIKTFSLDEFNLEKYFLERNENINLVKKNYSEERLIQSMEKIFKDSI